MGVRDLAVPGNTKARYSDNTRQGRVKASGSQTGSVGSGLKDVWVIGETFFRGVAIVFDVKEKMVGFRAL